MFFGSYIWGSWSDKYGRLSVSGLLFNMVEPVLKDHPISQNVVPLRQVVCSHRFSYIEMFDPLLQICGLSWQWSLKAGCFIVSVINKLLITDLCLCSKHSL